MQATGFAGGLDLEFDRGFTDSGFRILHFHGMIGGQGDGASTPFSYKLEFVGLFDEW